MQSEASNGSHPNGRKKSRFPPSKRVEFAGALGLVVWVWSEMLATHEVKKLIVQWLILFIFYIPICYYVFRWSRHKWLGYMLFFGSSVFTAIFAYWNSEYPAFTMVPRIEYVELKTPRYFLFWIINGQKVLSPVHVRMLAQFTNLRDKAMMITSYQFEGHTTNGEWQVMHAVDVKYGQLIGFAGTNLGTASMNEVLLGPVHEGDVFVEHFDRDLFPSILEGNNIPPGATVTGQVFLEAPKDGFDGNMRFRVIDATDGEFVELVRPVKPITYLDTWVAMNQSQGALREPEDVSKLPKIRFSELLKSSH